MTKPPTQARSASRSSATFSRRPPPGDALEETRLAARFGVAHTGAQEITLVQAGLVTKRAHKERSFQSQTPAPCWSYSRRSPSWRGRI